MRFLADQKFPRRAILALRAIGHDVVWIEEDAPGASDDMILARAEAEGRILLTFDKDWESSPIMPDCRRPAESCSSVCRCDARGRAVPGWRP